MKNEKTPRPVVKVPHSDRNPSKSKPPVTQQEEPQRPEPVDPLVLGKRGDMAPLPAEQIPTVSNIHATENGLVIGPVIKTSEAA